ncbi:conserved hypothetical protein [Rhodobacterales bacterium Y4I]|nr:conserved hypothetical protein [Rhodobacterales bacterium Y4I]
MVDRAARDLAESVVLPRLDAGDAGGQAAQQATITSLLQLLAQRAETLQAAAAEVLALEPAAEVVYTPISKADAVIRYAGNFAPSWAGAIAIDLLPAVLVLIVAVAQGAVRAGRDPAEPEDSMTVAELRAAVLALREVEAAAPGAAWDSEDEETAGEAETSSGSPGAAGPRPGPRAVE